MSAYRFDPDSDRPCRACGHALPHNHTEYETTHRCCRFVREKWERGIDCGHKRRREAKDCDDCWISEQACPCSEEDRLIADLRTRIAELEATLTAKEPTE